MGCDIHVHVEVKIDGEWHHYNHPRVERNYALFHKMAGVRDGEDDPIAQPRGLPDDISFMTRFDAEEWSGDAHSHSWLSATETQEVINWHNKKYGDPYPQLFGYVFGNSFSSVHKYPDESPPGVTDVRIVFWFDN